MGWRFRVVLEYDGAEFFGWQVQPDQRTVQGELVRALKRMGEFTLPTGAGRTDRGVHALNYPCHVDTERAWAPHDLLRALRGLTPSDIHVVSVSPADASFHARFDAVSRTYIYALARDFDPFFRHRRGVETRLPDAGWANHTLSALLGAHDFASFARTGSDPHTTRCDLSVARWDALPDGALVTLTADRFLYGMVRAIVGSLLSAFQNGLDTSALADTLAHQSRAAAGEAAPPGGLYLTQVAYPEDLAPAAQHARVCRLAGLSGPPVSDRSSSAAGRAE